MSTEGEAASVDGTGRAAIGRRCPLCGRDPARAWSRQELVVWWKCAGCGLYYVHPQPDPSQLAELYRSAYYEQPGLESDRERERSARRWMSRVQEIESIVPGGRTLDVGCGRGPFLCAARRRGWEVWGMEPSLEALAGLPAPHHRHAIVGRLPSAPFEPWTFDVVTLFDVLEHVRRPVDFLRHAAHVLRPGGRVVITTPNAASWKARWLRGRWKYFEFERYLHLYHFTPRTLELALKSAGLGPTHWLRRRGMPLFAVADAPADPG